MSNSLRSQGLQHARPPWPSPTQTHAIQPSHSLLSPSPPALNLSQHQGLFKWVSSPHQVAKILEFHFNISPSNEYSGPISFRMDWLDLLEVQGTLKSPPTTQFKNINSSVLSFLYSLTLTFIHDFWKNHSLTRQNFVGKVMSLLFNMLSKLVITFLPRSKHLLISWLQSPSAVILEPRKIKSGTVSTVSPSICMKWWDQTPWS